MLKNLLKVVTTSTLLFGCYLGYVRAFNLVVRQFQADRRTDITIFHTHDSRSKQHAQELARLAFGEKHWTVTSDQPYAYYSSEHRFWMYALQYEEIKKENGVDYNGKRLRMKPFAMIWTSGDGKKIQRLTADSATLDLNQPIGLGNKQSSDGVKVLHAHIEGDVRIRDDRGTPVVLTDDMNIGPMTYLDFDDETQQITSESHVDIVDPDQTTIGDGLVIQLRKPDFEARPAQGSSSSGFGGVEFAILKKNVHVVMRDVGQSGMFPGSGPKAAKARNKSTTAKTVDVVASTTVKDPAAKDVKSPANDEPVPLIIQSEGPMRVDWPPDRVPVAEGPPAPPAPTLVRFDRDVVALHGRIDRQPNQLNCDTLRLTLIPGAPPPPPARRDKAGADEPGKAIARAEGQDRSAAPTDPPASPPRFEPTVAIAARTEDPKKAAATAGDTKAGPDGTAGDAALQAPASPPNQGLFGNLTLQKAHATGHAVWLQLRQQGSKVRCKEMIHDRRMPYAPDSTAFRGDRTQPIWLEKIDYEPEEPDDDAFDDDGNPLVRSDGSPNRPREVSSVTHVVTASATLYDRGHGLDLADVRAYGPGKLETRPDLKEPVERIAQWQDELIIVNVVGDDDKLRQKQVTLTGTRPFFVDLVKKTSLDAGREIKVFLKPPSPPPAGTATAMSGASPVAADGTRATHLAAKPTSADAFAAEGDGAGKDDTKKDSADGNAGSGLGGNLQIERLLAYRDVHFLAPNRRMEAREWLDAPFIEVDPPPPADTTPAAGMDDPADAAADADAPPSPDSTQSQPKAEAPATAPAAGTVAAKDSEPQTPAEPGMTGVADRIWAKVALPRGKGIDSEKSQRREKKKAARAAKAASALAATAAAATESTTASSAAAAAPKEAEADVREAWLTGNVAIHQDVEPDPNKKDKAKPQGNDIFGEAVYLDNKGKGKAIAQVYHRDPTNPTPIPGPIRWAKVATDDMIVYGEILWMDQAQDKIWAFGPGVLNQWTDRAMLTDKSPEPKPDADVAAARAVAMADGPPAVGAGPARMGTARSDVPAGPPAPPKPRTRAGRPIGDKDLLTITWTKRMEFNGRTTDPSGRPAGRADFFGIVNSQMTDARLYCEQKMIAFTDREVPLAQVGSALGRPGKGGARGKDQPERPDGDDEDERTGPNGSRVDIALLYCYGNPVAISRKVDPDVPIVLEKERIDAWDYQDLSQGDGKTVFPGRIDYNRRTGEFYVPGPGIVYLYDRPNEDQNKDGAGPASAPPANAAPAARGGARTANGRTVTPTAARSPRGGNGAAAPAGRGAAKPRQAAAPATPAVTRKFPPLVLMQVKFSIEMRGRMGAGQANDTRQERWSEFFGDIEFLRSEVKHDRVILNPDDRLEDGFYLTSQILRIIQEPPPAGSPEKTPARSFAKAWDRVHVNKGETMAIEADVTTYDSGTDLLWAYGEGERGVTFAQQAAPGQPLSANYGKAFQYNVKSHAGRFVRSDSLSFVDHKTGARPTNVAMPDPTAPPKKKGKKPFFVPNTNLERRGFTGY